MRSDTVIDAVDVLLFESDSADNAEAAVSLSAVPFRRNVLRAVYFGYEDVPAAGDRLLQIVWTLSGATKTFIHALTPATVAQRTHFLFEEGEIVGDVNTAISITLASGGQGAGVFGYLNVFYRI